MIYLGIDPGERTGVAVLDVPEDATPVLIAYWEVTGGFEGFKKFWNGPDLPVFNRLVVEEYIIRGGVPQNHARDPLAIVAYLADHSTPILQPPAGRRVSVSDDVLRRLGVYLPGRGLRNAREAVRHVIWRLKQERHMPTLRVGWSKED